MKTKQERIAEMAGKTGIFQIFAIDHRDVFVRDLEEKLGRALSKEEIRKEKQRLMKVVEKETNGYLIDPVYFVKEDHLHAELYGHPYMMGVENNNYDVNAIDDHYLYPGITVKKIREMGGSMIKLFVYYHPEKEFRHKVMQVIRKVEKECAENDMPFLLEPILYTEKSVEPECRFALMKKMLEQMKDIKVDLYKLEFPGEVKKYTEEKNIALCKEIGKMIHKPWIILSAGIDRETFLKQIRMSGQGGACGYAVGRSVWGKYPGEEIAGLEGMKETLRAFSVCAEQYCHSWQEI